jgi:predicted metal-dependent peptidase
MSTPLPPRVLKARLQLMLVHPYLASALARLPVVNAADLGWCRTMATDGYYIYVNPAWCETLADEEITAVFAHEVMHAVLGHIDRRGDRERFVWNLAIDYATNWLLQQYGFKLPASALIQPSYRALTAEQIYDVLIKQAIKLPLGFDLHLEPGDAEGASQRGHEYPSADERRRLRVVILREMARKLAERGQGTLPAELAREIERASRPQVTWQQLLARFINGLRRSDYRLYPFNKKHVWRQIYMPSLGVPGPDHLVLGIDTSGSITAADLGQFVAELDRLRSLTDCRLTVVQCDAAVQKVDEVQAGEPTILPEARHGQPRLAGGGGTDFRPVFTWMAEHCRGGGRLDALIYCTDGYGSFPEKAPPYPVVWVVTKQGLAEFPFGLVIRLQDP